MKSFREYLSEAEYAAENPVAGDMFAISIREECLIESVVLGETSDGVIIAADQEAMRLLESYGYTFEETCMDCGLGESNCGCDHAVDEAKYQGREVPLGKPMKGDVKKSKVYVKGPKGNVVKVNFGDPNMKIKKNIPGRRKNFRARHNCDNPGPRWKARYWSCRAW